MSSATVDFVNINMQPEYELSILTRFGQFHKFKKFELGGSVLPTHPLMKQFFHGAWVLVDNYLRVRFDLPSSINFRYI